MATSTFTGRHVLVTGAASGIGRLLAQRFAREGARLTLWDLDESSLAAVCDELRAGGAEATPYRCDVSDAEAVRSTAEAVLAAHGAVDVLVNNAGVVSGGTLLEITDAQIERTFAVNTLALFHTTRAFLPSMIARGRGHVVTVASAGGLLGAARLTDYGASKFGAVGFDEALRLEMKRLGHPIDTTVVCPFYIDTGMFEGVRTRVPWLLPILKPDYVADRIVAAVRKKRRRLIMPRFVYTVFPLRLLPVDLFDAIAGVFGINRTMDAFVGRRHAGATS